MKINEQNFIKSLQAGKEDALDYVIDQYLPLIKGVVLKTLGPLGHSYSLKECCNYILFSIWKDAKKFNGDAVDLQKGFRLMEADSADENGVKFVDYSSDSPKEIIELEDIVVEIEK